MSAAPRVTVRAAVAADAEPVASLLQLAVDEARPERGGALLIDLDFRGSPLLPAPDDPGARLLVGRVDDVVVGFLAVRKSTAHRLTVATVDQIFVHPEARGVGVGAAMLNEAEVTARSWGATSLESQVLPGNRAAKNFFERMGLVTRKMQVSRSLDAD